jgi:hypothetical protein
MAIAPALPTEALRMTSLFEDVVTAEGFNPPARSRR